MNVLSVIHGTDARAELFSTVVEEAGHAHDEWSLAWRTPPPRPVDSYDAVLVFGGAMHADQEERHPWLLRELRFIHHVLERGTPFFGVCLGAQLLARAAGASVHPAAESEVGWHGVELTDAAASDPIFAELPARFDAFQWHHYTYDVPGAGVELARSTRCTQAYRLGRAYGIQFHAEVTQSMVGRWLEEDPADVDDAAALRDETEARIEDWNALGRRVCTAFLATV